MDHNIRAKDIVTLFKIGYGYLKWIMFKPKEKLPEMHHKGGEKMNIKLEYEPEHLVAANVSGQAQAQQQVAKVEP